MKVMAISGSRMALPRVGLALRANLAAPVGVWLQRVHAMVPDPVRTGA
ncbi:MAG: hypothetical protein RLZ70_1941, partial [Verrucomicrobiota bacterium]